jgi:hypothetical protein
MHHIYISLGNDTVMFKVKVNGWQYRSVDECTIRPVGDNSINPDREVF